MFELDDRLKQDTVTVGRFKLSLVLLHKDANFPWVILVPARDKIREIHHLTEEDQIQLIKESSHLSEVMTSLFAPTTMNIAALGNQVSQLHVHHVARFKDDPAWPNAIWGYGKFKAYDEAELNKRLDRLHGSLVGEGFEASCGFDDGSLNDVGGFTP